LQEPSHHSVGVSVSNSDTEKES